MVGTPGSLLRLSLRTTNRLSPNHRPYWGRACFLHSRSRFAIAIPVIVNLVATVVVRLDATVVILVAVVVVAVVVAIVIEDAHHYLPCDSSKIC